MERFKLIIVTHFLPIKKRSRVQPENPYYILNVHRLQLEILVFNSSQAAGTSDAVSPINELAIILHDFISIFNSFAMHWILIFHTNLNRLYLVLQMILRFHETLETSHHNLNSLQNQNNTGRTWSQSQFLCFLVLLLLLDKTLCCNSYL